MNRLVLIFLALIMSACGGQSTNSNKIGDVIDIHGNVEHLDRMDEFVQKASNYEEASIRVVHYTIEGDPIYHDLFVKEQNIELKYDTREDKFGSGRVTTYTCDKLERIETDTQLDYTLKGCTGDNKEWVILQLSFDVEKQDYFGFQLKYGYGVNEKNEVDTVNKKLVKDLQNGETATINDFQLSTMELQTIYRKMVLSNYLGKKELVTACNQEPHQSYYLKVLINSGNREYRWSECDVSEDGKTMTELMNVIKDVVSQRDDYRKLPDVKGAYL